MKQIQLSFILHNCRKQVAFTQFYCIPFNFFLFCLFLLFSSLFLSVFFLVVAIAVDDDVAVSVVVGFSAKSCNQNGWLFQKGTQFKANHSENGNAARQNCFKTALNQLNNRIERHDIFTWACVCVWVCVCLSGHAYSSYRFISVARIVARSELY